MRFWPFQIANVTSALIWSASLLVLGAAGWAAVKSVWHSLGGWPAIAVAVIAIAIGIAFRDRIGSALRSLTAKLKGGTA